MSIDGQTERGDEGCVEPRLVRNLCSDAARRDAEPERGNDFAKSVHLQNAL